MVVVPPPFFFYPSALEELGLIVCQLQNAIAEQRDSAESGQSIKVLFFINPFFPRLVVVQT